MHIILLAGILQCTVYELISERDYSPTASFLLNLT
jgi:hypothetical protein